MDKDKEESGHSGHIVACIDALCQYPHPRPGLLGSDARVVLALITPLQVKDRPVNVQVLRARVAEFLHHYFPEARGPVVGFQHGDSENYAVIS